MDPIERATTIINERLGKLTALGSADAIALELEGLGVQAHCGNMRNCAIAVDLTREVAHLGYEVHVPANHAVLLVDASYNFPALAAIPYMEPAPTEMIQPQRGMYHRSHPLNEFIHGFDGQKYPALLPMKQEAA